MKFNEFKDNSKEPDLIQVFRDFLPIAMAELKISQLPKIRLKKQLEHGDQPSFGSFVYSENNAEIYLAVKDRHPLDIIRTLAHELVHYKQHTEHRLNKSSGKTGSPDENEAHITAGIIMRNFDKQFPKYFKNPSITLGENFKDGRNPQDKGDSKRHNVPTKASVSTLRKVAKQGGRRGQLAHWMANMKAGRKKAATEAIAPHGSPENEFEMMKAGTKPAVLVNPHTFLDLYKPMADKLNWPYQQIKLADHDYNSYAVGQLGEEKRVQRLATLVQDMNANLARGVKPDKEYHIEMGRLLGYSDQDIRDFLKKINLDEEYKDADYARGGEKMPAAKPGRKQHPLRGKLVGGQ